MGPIRKLILKRIARRGLDHVAGLAFLTSAQRRAVLDVRDRHFNEVVQRLMDRTGHGSSLAGVIDGVARGEGERPILDWLFKEGGWKIIYSIVQVILLMFGIVLPPLPPTPTPPAPSEGEDFAVEAEVLTWPDDIPAELSVS